MVSIEVIKETMEQDRFHVCFHITRDLDFIVQRASQEEPTETYFHALGAHYSLPSDGMFHPEIYDDEIPSYIINSLEEMCESFPADIRDYCFKEIKEAYTAAFAPRRNFLVVETDSISSSLAEYESSHALWYVLLMTVDDCIDNLSAMSLYLDEFEDASSIIDDHAGYYVRLREVVAKGLQASHKFSLALSVAKESVAAK